MAAVWPNVAVNTSDDVWPTLADLKAWVRSEEVAATSPTVLERSFRAADQMIRSRINRTLLLARAAEVGLVTDVLDDDYDQAALEAWCPAYVFQAILIRSASIFTRRDSANGTIAFGEFAAKVAKMDPDVDELLSPVTIPGIA